MDYQDDFPDEDFGVCDRCLDEFLDADLVDGLCSRCREAAAVDAGEEPTESAGTIRTPEDLFTAGSLRQAARAGVAGAAGDEAEALLCRDAALAEQADRGGELLAARAEVERLRIGVQEIADALRTVYKGSDSGLPALALRRRALALLAAPASPPAEGGEE